MERSIRFHHLELWNVVVREYFKHFGKMPWELSGDERPKVNTFTREFASMITEQEIDKLNEYEEANTPSQNSPLRYLYDVIGDDEEDFKMVSKNRADALNAIFRKLFTGGDSRILLTMEPDGICGACAVGSHCLGTDKGKVEKPHRDHFYKEAVIYFATNKYSEVRPEEKISVEGEGIYITGELLFDPEFHKMLGDRVKSEHPAWFKHSGK